MRAIMLGLVTCFLTACGSSSHAIQSPDGNHGQTQSISCRRTIENCWEEAASTCPRGYDVLDRGSDFKMIPTAIGPVATQKHSMLVRCR